MMTQTQDGPRILYVCEFCAENSPDCCGRYDASEIRQAPGGEWLCEYCYDEYETLDDEGSEDGPLFSDLPTAALRVPAPAVPDDVAEPSDEVKAYLDGVIGVVEANGYESLCLWQEYTGRNETWVSTGHGYGPCVGQVRGAPVCISILTKTIRGHKIAFIEPTSRVVDWNIIDLWLEKALPKTAFNEKGHVNETDAMNFHNIFPRAALTQPTGDRT